MVFLGYQLKNTEKNLNYERGEFKNEVIIFRLIASNDEARKNSYSPNRFSFDGSHRESAF